jgi:hypothetical protein
MKEWWKWGSVNKINSSAGMDSWNYLNSGGSLWAEEISMLKSNCVKLQNEVQEKYPFLFKWNLFPPLRKNI